MTVKTTKPTPVDAATDPVGRLAQLTTDSIYTNTPAMALDAVFCETTGHVDGLAQHERLAAVHRRVAAVARQLDRMFDTTVTPADLAVVELEHDPDATGDKLIAAAVKAAHAIADYKAADASITRWRRSVSDPAWQTAHAELEAGAAERLVALEKWAGDLERRLLVDERPVPQLIADTAASSRRRQEELRRQLEEHDRWAASGVEVVLSERQAAQADERRRQLVAALAAAS